MKKLLYTAIGCLSLFAMKAHAQCTFKEKPQLELFYSPYCFYSIKVLQYLESIHKTVPLKNVAQDPKLRDELIERGGKSQIPCLFIDGIALYESDAIIEFLEKNQACLSDVEENAQADLKVQPE